MTFNASCVSLSPSIFYRMLVLARFQRLSLTFFLHKANALTKVFSFRKHTATCKDNEFCAGPFFHFRNLFQIVSLSQRHIAHFITLIPLKDQGHSIPSFV